MTEILREIDSPNRYFLPIDSAEEFPQAMSQEELRAALEEAAILGLVWLTDIVPTPSEQRTDYSVGSLMRMPGEQYGIPADLQAGIPVVAGPRILDRQAEELVQLGGFSVYRGRNAQELIEAYTIPADSHDPVPAVPTAEAGRLIEALARQRYQNLGGVAARASQEFRADQILRLTHNHLVHTRGVDSQFEEMLVGPYVMERDGIPVPVGGGVVYARDRNE